MHESAKLVPGKSKCEFEKAMPKLIRISREEIAERAKKIHAVEADPVTSATQSGGGGGKKRDHGSADFQRFPRARVDSVLENGFRGGSRFLA